METPDIPTEDSSSPFYLQYSQSLGTTLVSKLLIGENYVSWSRAMIITLSAKNKLDFVDGSITKLEGRDANLVSY